MVALSFMLTCRKPSLSFQDETKQGELQPPSLEEGLLPGDWSHRESEPPQVRVFMETKAESHSL